MKLFMKACGDTQEFNIGNFHLKIGSWQKCFFPVVKAFLIVALRTKYCE
jgi:hypothetical protein